jgi:hypothetical protein
VRRSSTKSCAATTTYVTASKSTAPRIPAGDAETTTADESRSRREHRHGVRPPRGAEVGPRRRRGRRERRPRQKASV